MASRRHSEVAETQGREEEASSLCSEAKAEARRLPHCSERGEKGSPYDIEAGESCDFQYSSGNPGDEEIQLSVRSSASWYCETR